MDLDDSRPKMWSCRAIASVLQLTEQMFFEVLGVPPGSKPLCLHSPVDAIVLLEQREGQAANPSQIASPVAATHLTVVFTEGLHRRPRLSSSATDSRFASAGGLPPATSRRRAAGY